MTRSRATDTSSASPTAASTMTRVVHRGDNRYRSPLGHDADGVQDLGSGRLHRKISQGARIGAGRALHHPAERRAQFKFEAGVVEHPLPEGFEDTETGTQSGENFGGLVERDTGTHRQGSGAEAVLNSEHDGFEQRANGLHLDCRHAVGEKAELPGNSEIDVARLRKRPAIRCLQTRPRRFVPPAGG